jgi:hypothetical protein
MSWLGLSVNTTPSGRVSVSSPRWVIISGAPLAGSSVPVNGLHGVGVVCSGPSALRYTMKWCEALPSTLLISWTWMLSVLPSRTSTQRVSSVPAGIVYGPQVAVYVPVVKLASFAASVPASVGSLELPPPHAATAVIAQAIARRSWDIDSSSGGAQYRKSAGANASAKRAPTAGSRARSPGRRRASSRPRRSSRRRRAGTG